MDANMAFLRFRYGIEFLTIELYKDISSAGWESMPNIKCTGRAARLQI